MRRVTFTAGETEYTCCVDSCADCKLWQRDHEIYGVSFRRIMRAHDGTKTCIRIDPVKVKYLAKEKP